MHPSRIALIAATALIAAPAWAQGSQVSSPVELARKADALKPGDWVWAPSIAPAGPVHVYVDLSRQVATVYRNGVRIGVSTVSSGKPGHETPTGVFVILQKDANHHSSKYNNAPMRFQERLTWDGVALHAGGLPGYPESHGCIHLPLEFSRLLFQTTSMGGVVVIAGQAGHVAVTGSAGVLDPVGAAGANVMHVPLAADEDFRWTPAAAPDGPVTIILSRSDERAVVLRRGVEIGRARIKLPQDDYQTQVLTYAASAAGKPRWIAVGVPGHEGEDSELFDTGILSEAQLPPAFLDDLRSVIVPGTTILVTQSPILPQKSGKPLTIMASGAP